MKLGYARLPTDIQETDLQMDALKQAKCVRVYEDKASGAKAARPELMRLLDNARKGDVVVVWKLERLAHSLRQSIDTAVLLNERGATFTDGEHQHNNAHWQVDPSSFCRSGRIRA